MTDLGVEDRLLFCPHCRAAYRSELTACPLDGATLQREETDPLLGLTINEQYTITDCIAYGATSRVYRAHHTRLWRREFAIKVLLGDLIAEQDTRMRFAQEAELLSRLDHPNVVSVVDFARTPEGLLYLVMDLAHGPTLAELIGKHGAMPWRRAVTLAQQMCRGLAHAHAQGIVHRDFKPDNIIIERTANEELARIIDFGIALPPPDDSIPRLTSTDISLGTPAYASPEQAFNTDLDHRIDLFALGVTLYEMLAGALPFSGDAYELLHNNAFHEAPRISVRNPAVDVPSQIERVVRRLMAKDPRDRFQTAAEVATALDEALADLPLTRGMHRAAALTPRRLDLRATESLTQLAMRPPPREVPIWIKAAGGVAVLGAAAVLLIGQLRSAPRPPIVVAPEGAVAAPVLTAPAAAVEGDAPAPPSRAETAANAAAPSAERAPRATSAAAAPQLERAASDARDIKPPSVAASAAAAPVATRAGGAPPAAPRASGEARLILRPADLDAHSAAESAAAAAASAEQALSVEAAKVAAERAPGSTGDAVVKDEAAPGPTSGAPTPAKADAAGDADKPGDAPATSDAGPTSTKPSTPTLAPPPGPSPVPPATPAAPASTPPPAMPGGEAAASEAAAAQASPAP